MQNTEISLVLEILPCLLKKAEEYCQALKPGYSETDLETLRQHLLRNVKQINALD